MKKLFIGLLSFFIVQVCFGQTSDNIPVRAQGVFLEGLGPSLIVGLNYDTRFSNRRDGLGGRAGLGYFAAGGNNLLTIPVMLNYLLGKEKHYFEVGLGATFATGAIEDIGFTDSNKTKGSNFIGTSVFGYRYQPLDNGFQFRAGFSPVFGNGYFIPYWPYLSVGYSF